MAERPPARAEEPLRRLLVAMADDELVLGHRNAEWTGHAPILEEDIAFSNIAQDELGHALAWFTVCERLTGRSPDAMAFERSWEEFTCARLVTYPRGDFAYTVVRQYLFDEAEQVRLRALAEGSWAPLREVAAKILREEAYHLLHVKGLLLRLSVATEESRRRMTAAVAEAYPQALGLFEPLEGEEILAAEGIVPVTDTQRDAWMERVRPVLPALPQGAMAEFGGRRGSHTAHLPALVADLQKVYRLAPGAAW